MYGKVVFADSNSNDSHKHAEEAYALPKRKVFSCRQYVGLVYLNPVTEIDIKLLLFSEPICWGWKEETSFFSFS